MGMAASQARLLTITARIHDVEYEAQSIQNAKIQLATQEDEIQKNYLAALDATTLTVKDSAGNLVTANFNNLCGINGVDVATNKRYAFRDERNRLIVPDEIYEGYKNFKSIAGADSSNAYLFAMYMIDGCDPNFVITQENYKQAENDLISSMEEEGYNSPFKEIKEKMGKVLEEAFEYTKGIEKYGQAGLSEGTEISIENIENCISANVSEMDEESKSRYEEFKNSPEYAKIKECCDQYRALNDQFMFRLYTQNDNAKDIYTTANDGSNSLFDEEDFAYYVNMYKQVQEAGENIINISSFDGLDGIGDAGSDSDWLQQMIKSGKITVDTVTRDNKTGKVSFSATGVPSDSVLEYTTTSTIDKTALAKAEAEYEYNMKKIDRKDKQYDMTLSKLETERSALTTEYDSVKKVIEDNIERTFGIFS